MKIDISLQLKALNYTSTKYKRSVMIISINIILARGSLIQSNEKWVETPSNFGTKWYTFSMFCTNNYFCKELGAWHIFWKMILNVSFSASLLSIFFAF